MKPALTPKSLLWTLVAISILGCGKLATAQGRDASPTAMHRYGSGQRGGALSNVALPNLDAYSADGTKLKLRELCQGKVTVLVAGCLTCPQFHRGYPEIEAASRDYAAKGVQFFYFYKSLRHPELNGYVEAQNINERLLQLAEARRMLGTKVPWIADTIDNQIRDGLRSANNSMFVISPEGDIAFAADHLDGPALRKALVKFAGKVDRPTLASDLSFPRFTRQRTPPNVDSDTRVARPDGLVILSTTPHDPSSTYYVKLRAEADSNLLQTGTGRLLLGFYPDPIHGVHWNNLTEPMKFSLTLPPGIKATPDQASAKRGDGDKDVEPRQFWVEIEGKGPGGSIEIAMHYFGCTDTMCKALTQRYTIDLKPANMGSSTFGFNRGPRGASGRQSKQQGQRGRSPKRGSPRNADETFK
ncbi:hypothetical protein [Neorhodopirellula lusitana]|uniref:hypothetical protein n=1 Tax=Neorhodopirellula lusitana TaxID=445327 RepID=UPI00384A97FA